MKTSLKTNTILYTGKTHTVGGRGHGTSRSSDGCLDIKLSTPGTDRIGTNPEQLLAAGWSACFQGAMSIVAGKTGVMLPDETAIDAEVDLCLDKGEYYLKARLNVTIPGLDKDIAQQMVNIARQVCPYTKALERTVNVQFIIF